MFHAKWILGIVDFDAVRLIRDEVFVKERNLPENVAFDDRDAYSAHLIITDQETGDPMATARISPAGKFTRIGEIAVRSKYRATNYAEFALRMLLYKAQKLSGAKIIATIPEDEFKMYESFGFSDDGSCETSGFLNVSVDTDKVHWHSECHD